MIKEITARLKEGLMSILPIAVILVILNFAIPGLSFDDATQYPSHVGPAFVAFLLALVPMILGMAFFNLGADKSTGRIGILVGGLVSKKKALGILLFIALLMGTLTTLAEPDLTVLATRLYPDSHDSGMRILMIVTSSVGVGVFLLVAILRVIYDKSIKYWLVIGYSLVFVLGYFIDPDFFSIIFDSGGVTTGPVTVPFIISLGISVSSMLGGSKAEDDSFGYSGLCTLGTVLSVTLFAVVMKHTGAMDSMESTFGSMNLLTEINSYQGLADVYRESFLSNLKGVAISMIPITLFFLVYNFFLKLKKPDFFSIIIGLVYVFVGLVLFLFSSEAGLSPAASRLGKAFATLPLYVFMLVVFSCGVISMLAEPGVHVLADQVNEVSRGAISRPTIFFVLGLSTGLSLVLNVIRVHDNIPIIDFVIPILAVGLVLAFFTPEIYVAIAIDAAGVATGTMASCLFLPMFIGYTSSLYQNSANYGQMILRNGFGVVGMMSLMPIACVEIVGILSVIKTKIGYQKALKAVMEPDDAQIVHLPV